VTTKAVRMHGKGDLRLDEFELPPIRENEILAHVVSDSLCMSSYKAAEQGSDHKRVPDGLETNPVMVGHEFCGEIVEVGSAWRSQFEPGSKFSIQPALNYKGSLAAPGYSYPFLGGDATYVVIPNEVMECGCLLPYCGEPYFLGSLSEPISCIIGAFNAMYHTRPGSYEHSMGIARDGRMAILAGAGPMGLGMIDYAIHRDRKPSLLVVTDIDQVRLDRARSLYTVEEAGRNGVTLEYVNTSSGEDAVARLMALSGGQGFDDVFVLAPVGGVVEQGDRILGTDGCLHFFAGPTDSEFAARINFYRLHYAFTHFVGTSGGNTGDMIEALELMGSGAINPAAMITHVGGLDSVADTTLRLPQIPGGKKLIYTNISMELTPLEEFESRGATDPFLAGIAEIVVGNNGLWSPEAENYLLANALPI
jgi:threonine dehydrogenase-like Zn-dependent dehydrogenase